MTRTTSSFFHAHTNALLLSALFLLGVLGTGCGSAGSMRQGGTASASASSANRTLSEQDAAPEQQTQQDASTTASADPVKVLRLSKVRKRLENAAKDWYGTPYDWGGESKQGVDCSGFVKNVYQDAFSYSLPRVTESQLQSGSRVSRDQIRPGDLVFFRPEGEYNHVGVYLGEGQFAHASSSNGVTKSQMQNEYWNRYYWTTRRPLTPSSIPKNLESELLAYRYPESDSTVAMANASEKNQQSSESEEQDAPSNTQTEGTKIASCDAESVECADASASNQEMSDSEEEETGKVRKGW